MLSMLTGHGRATPLLWKTVASSTLGQPAPLRVAVPVAGGMPAGVKVAVVGSGLCGQAVLRTGRN